MATSNKQEKTTKPTKQKWSLKKKIAVIAGVVLVFIIAIVYIANTATSAPLKVSDELVADIQTSDSTAAYELMSNDAQAATDPQDFATAIDRIGSILDGEPKLQSKEVSAETGSNPTAKVVYLIEGNDNVTYKFTVNLTQDQGEWRILNFESDAQ